MLYSNSPFPRIHYDFVRITITIHNPYRVYQISSFFSKIAEVAWELIPTAFSAPAAALPKDARL